ncbi:MAG: MarR family transcriptional regulator [Oscillospiraceae bacterium]|nr:MarR family transcriptional regulator [Oscillospiraceae bacterium]
MDPNGDFHVGTLIKRINDTMEKRANNALQQHDITFFQMRVLIILSTSEDGTATLKELERGFGVAQSTAAGVAVRLEKKGLITSYADARDRRVKRVQITPAGRTLCINHREEMDQNEARLTQTLSPQEQEQLKSLLLRVYAALEEE